MDRGYITTIGSLSIDENYGLESWPQEGDKKIIYHKSQQVGGMIANVACNLGSLGMDVNLLYPFANDQYLPLFQEELSRYKVKYNHCKIYDEAETTTCLIMHSDKERTIFIDLGRIINYPLDEKQLELIKNSRYVYSTISELKRIVNQKELFDALNHTHLILDVEPETFEGYSQDQRYFECAEILFMNEFGCEKYTRTEGNIFEYIQEENRVIVCTRAEKGATAYYKKDIINVKGINVEVIDPTGAGDMFNASFIRALMVLGNVRDALEYANKAAAAHVQLFGPKKRIEEA